MKTCIKCGTTKEITEFYKHGSSKDGRRGQCKPCRSGVVAEQKARQRKKINAYKLMMGCRRCGFKEHAVALHFHHPSDKNNSVSNLIGCSDEKVWEEIAKCFVLCANCHMIEHHA